MASGAAFEPLKRMDGTGFTHVVCSGLGGWGVIPHTPSCYGRVVMAAAAAGVRSFQLVELTGRQEGDRVH